jgi:hypothetical protein
MSDLHVCADCRSELVYPLDWSEEGPRHWRIVLRCPECESRREGVFEHHDVELFDDERERGAVMLFEDLQRVTHLNMAEEADSLAKALELDLVTAEDFL